MASLGPSLASFSPIARPWQGKARHGNARNGSKIHMTLSFHTKPIESLRTRVNCGLVWLRGRLAVRGEVLWRTVAEFPGRQHRLSFSSCSGGLAQLGWLAWPKVPPCPGPITKIENSVGMPTKSKILDGFRSWGPSRRGPARSAGECVVGVQLSLIPNHFH